MIWIFRPPLQDRTPVVCSVHISVAEKKIDFLSEKKNKSQTAYSGSVAKRQIGKITQNAMLLLLSRYNCGTKRKKRNRLQIWAWVKLGGGEKFFIFRF